MTTTVRKGTNRPAAAAKTAKAAQRTALPPKVPTPNEMEAAVRPARTAKNTTAKAPERARTARKDAPATEAPAKPTKSTSRTRTATKGTKVLPNSIVLPEDFPGRSKIMRLVEGGPEHGWVPKIVNADPKTGAVEVVLSKGDETMTWFGVGGSQDPAQAPRWSDGSRTVMMKNIKSILDQASGARITVKPASARKAPATRRDQGDVPQKRLPFDPANATDEEVRDALLGRTISWTNGISKAIDSAIINVRGKLTIEEHPQSGRRMVTFSDPINTGTRTVLLERLVEVK